MFVILEARKGKKGPGVHQSRERHREKVGLTSSSRWERKKDGKKPGDH